MSKKMLGDSRCLRWFAEVTQYFPHNTDIVDKSDDAHRGIGCEYTIIAMVVSRSSEV
jgi:hypothetical protein